MKYQKSYLIKIQFLGFRFHGWQKQLDVKTVHDLVDKSLSFVIDKPFKTLGIGRTDAKVSAQSFYIQLFTNDALRSDFISEFNRNLPADIAALEWQEVDLKFNIIQHPKLKTYAYFFTYGEKSHPFTAPFMVSEPMILDIELMQKGAQLFRGEHWFHKYVTRPSENTIFQREIIQCEIVENDILTANFFPKKSYVLKVQGSGFLRYQIRLMMGVLFQLGKGEIDLEFIVSSLKEDNDRHFLRQIAPSSGLQLLDVELAISDKEKEN